MDRSHMATWECIEHGVPVEYDGPLPGEKPAPEYIKARFTSLDGATAGLVFNVEAFESMTISEFSRLFPISEARFMRAVEVSPRYQTWEAAFNHDFGRVEA